MINDIEYGVTLYDVAVGISPDHASLAQKSVLGKDPLVGTFDAAYRLTLRDACSRYGNSMASRISQLECELRSKRNQIERLWKVTAPLRVVRGTGQEIARWIRRSITRIRVNAGSKSGKDSHYDVALSLMGRRKWFFQSVAREVLKSGSGGLAAMPGHGLVTACAQTGYRLPSKAFFSDQSGTGHNIGNLWVLDRDHESIVQS